MNKSYFQNVSILLLVVFLSISFKSISFSKQGDSKYLDYPIEYTQYATVFTGKLTPRLLFYTPENLFYATNTDGIIVKCTIDKKTKNNNELTYNLSLNLGKKKLLLFTIKLQISEDDNCNYMTYLRMKNVENGMANEFKYDADNVVSSYGGIMGGFNATAQYMFNVVAINKSFVKEEDSSSSDDSVQDTNNSSTN